ncbi:MAG: cadherin-like domain-containing protein [Oscillospiraceae bacterium]|nr:cadherin-like domain-containing protein [Oscillospiraceae bacterium]
MIRTRILSLLAAVCCLAALALPAAAAEVECDAAYCFSSADFSEDENLAGICITGLPDAASGTVMLGTRVVQRGDILTAQQLTQMTFHPLRTEADQEATLTYLPIFEDRVETAATMAIQVIGKQDQAPVAEDSAIETYKNLPNEAMLKAKDPEGETLTFTVTRQPKRGDVVIREDGSFHYTPKKNKVGVDSFTYTATDPAGNVSREATVTITIMKPEDAKQYADTAGKSCRFAAEWMKNTGIFVSESISGNSCFQPEKDVTRGEFLTMLVGALEIPLEEDAVFTGFTDESPDWLKPYLAAAMRSGLTAGWPDADTFRFDDPITGAEAAVMLQNALDLKHANDAAPVIVEAEAAAPAWAAGALEILESNGISLSHGETLSRGEAAQVFYQISCLGDAAPGILALRAAQ